MKKRTTLLFLCAMILLPASSKVRTQQEALLVAREFISESGMNAGQADAKKEMRCAFKSKASDAADYYVFNRDGGNGFVIVSGDDRAYDILGYSDTGSFDVSNVPVQMQAWLDEYSQEMAYLRSKTAGSTAAVRKTAKLNAAVSPLLGDLSWDQLAPFNGMTPYYVGTTHSATGCVATAMAQVMYYNRWPEQGQGTHTYTPYGWNQSFTVDFSQSRYGWDVMTPKYDSSSSDESKNAVAKLMYDCGVSVDMVYGEQSGADHTLCPSAYVNYFGYDKSIDLRNRLYYSNEEWDRVIRAELDAKRVVMAIGFTSSGGHAFVFDGYDTDGLIHVNWGWSGMSNGYFRTSALTPANQGTGGSVGGFNYKQMIITGIHKPQEGSEDGLEIVSSEKLKATPASAETSTKTSLKLTGKITNYGWKEETVDFGVGVYDSTGVLKFSAPADENVNFNTNTYKVGATAAGVDLSSLADGGYFVYPIVKVHGGKIWNKVKDYKYTKPNFLQLHIENGKYTFTYPASFSLTSKDAAVDTKVYQGIKAEMSGTIVNSGDIEYNGALKAALFNKSDGQLVASGDDYIEDIGAGDSLKVNVYGTFSVDPGDYLMAMIDENMEKINEPIAVTVFGAPTETAEVQFANQVSFPDNNNVPKDNMQLHATLKGIKGVSSVMVAAYIYDEMGENVKGCLNPEFIFLEGGNVASVTFSGPFENGVPGTKYKAQVIDLDNSKYIYPIDLSSCSFTLGGCVNGIGNAVETNGISMAGDVMNITEAAPLNAVAIYTANGSVVKRCVVSSNSASLDISGLSRGLYLVRTDHHIYKIVKK